MKKISLLAFGMLVSVATFAQELGLKNALDKVKDEVVSLYPAICVIAILVTGYKNIDNFKEDKFEAFKNLIYCLLVLLAIAGLYRYFANKTL